MDPFMVTVVLFPWAVAGATAGVLDFGLEVLEDGEAFLLMALSCLPCSFPLSWYMGSWTSCPVSFVLTSSPLWSVTDSQSNGKRQHMCQGDLSCQYKWCKVSPLFVLFQLISMVQGFITLRFFFYLLLTFLWLCWVYLLVLDGTGTSRHICDTFYETNYG